MSGMWKSVWIAAALRVQVTGGGNLRSFWRQSWTTRTMGCGLWSCGSTDDVVDNRALISIFM